MITILIFLLVSRHKKRMLLRARTEDLSWPPKVEREPSFDKRISLEEKLISRNRAKSNPKRSTQTNTQAPRKVRTDSDVSLSMFPATPSSETLQAGQRVATTSATPPKKSPANTKTTSLQWNPSNPPKAPTLTPWLTVRPSSSPFGPIRLPMDENSSTPLGGQLKSPHQTTNTTATTINSDATVPIMHRKHPRYTGVVGNSDLPLRAPKSPSVLEAQKVTIKPARTKSLKADKSVTYTPTTGADSRPRTGAEKGKYRTRSPPTTVSYLPSPLIRQYHAAKATVWTEESSPPTPTRVTKSPRSPHITTQIKEKPPRQEQSLEVSKTPRPLPAQPVVVPGPGVGRIDKIQRKPPPPQGAGDSDDRGWKSRREVYSIREESLERASNTDTRKADGPGMGTVTRTGTGSGSMTDRGRGGRDGDGTPDFWPVEGGKIADRRKTVLMSGGNRGGNGNGSDSAVRLA